MFPKDKNGVVKIIDWQSFENGMGAYDLAYMVALHWFPEKRKEYESVVLARYHQGLIENGIKDYSLESMLVDYRYSIVQLLFFPAYLWEAKISAGIWKGNFTLRTVASTAARKLPDFRLLSLLRRRRCEACASARVKRNRKRLSFCLPAWARHLPAWNKGHS